MKHIFHDSEVGEIKCIAMSVLRVFGYLLGFWLAFYALHVIFPYIRLGHQVINEAKQKHIRRTPLFQSNAKHRVLCFGNSRILAGFVPTYFDTLTSHSTESFNMGFAAKNVVVDELEACLKRGTRPTDVFLTLPWHEKTLSELKADPPVLQALLPFRNLPHDLFRFLYASRTHGGPLKFYADGRASAQRMLGDRGYYFIEGMSHFPGHKLPDDFTSEKDAPDQVASRNFVTNDPTFRRLQGLADEFHFQYVLIPIYYREGEVAPPKGPNQRTLKLLRSCSNFKVIGPDYFTFPNRYFSDVGHLNRDGARKYTEAIAGLFHPHIQLGKK